MPMRMEWDTVVYSCALCIDSYQPLIPIITLSSSRFLRFWLHTSPNIWTVWKQHTPLLFHRTILLLSVRWQVISHPTSLLQSPETGWPLVTTFAKLLEMLDATTSEPFFEHAHPMHTEKMDVIGMSDIISRDIINHILKQEDNRDPKPRKQRKQFVTYSRFSTSIWNEMAGATTSSLHPSLVWVEIQSHIKGSVDSVYTPHGFLPFDSYQSLGRRYSFFFLTPQARRGSTGRLREEIDIWSIPAVREDKEKRFPLRLCWCRVFSV